MMNFLLICGIVVGSAFQTTHARTAGFVQSSFISNHGGIASGAAESSVTGPDGIRKGECSYTDSNGRSVTINYSETHNGVITATTEASHVSDPTDALKKCRASITILQNDFTQNYQENQQQFNEQFTEFEKTFQAQMDLFNREQQNFAKQHQDFMRQMDVLNSQIRGHLPFTGIRQQPGLHHYNPFRFTLF